MQTNPKVDEFMDELEHPLKEELQVVRRIILEANPKMTEDIKWGGPTFSYGKNMATLTVRTKKFVHLFFQEGASIKDNSGLLDGDAEHVRVARFHSMEEVEEKKDDLVAVVEEFVRMQEAE
ncbi:MAG: DUF1801 domain-containing protein [Chloroflexi bacterium]|nr:MAG: DUF1801 domain-containing protein [Chloroflexota bacterium]MBL1193909.1 DUF1801 domain-containing protein [Chloroflexota bacterium]NOH11203.1 DUF1801 domain-containing protein [Chloroflexota bacterium]